MNAPERDDRILPETRIATFPLILVLLAAFISLYFWPDDTERMFAWTIKPRLTPLIMGAGYLGGAYAFSQLFVRGVRWHHVAFAYLAVEPFAIAMILSTILHWDRFNHAHIWFWVWVVVYGMTPVLLPLLWLRNRATDPGTPDPDEVRLPDLAIWILRVSGWAGIAVTAFLFLLPQQALQVCPWALTPLTARVIGGWYALSGATALVMSRDRRWSSSRIMVKASLILTGFMLIGVVRAWSDFDPVNPLTWAYIGFLAFTLIAFSWLYILMEGRRKEKAMAAESVPATL